jgi:hypothetical protein
VCGNGAERVRKTVSIERGKQNRKRRGYSEEWLLSFAKEESVGEE